uniref:Proepiregulin n=1 Tax=Sphenodon punctatus TaxID=8508 RepID=A0A8D0GNK1_SPHPU
MVPASCSQLRLASLLLLCLVFHQLQAALGTTVIPLCGRNETENCTTALVQTENSPRMAQVGITKCKPEMKDYCFHGQCMFLVEMDEHHCRCDVGFSGARCMHSELVVQPLSKEYVVLTVLLLLFLLVASLVAIYYFYEWYQGKKRRNADNKDYKEVATQSEKNSALLHM